MRGAIRARRPMLVALASLAVIGSGGCRKAPAEPAPAVAVAASKPAMWEVRSPTARLVILGTMHELPPRLDWYPGRVERALIDADELWLEVTPDELESAPQLVARMAADEPVAPLDRRLPPALAEEARALAREAQLPAAAADRLESWALAIAVSNAAGADAGLSRDNGVEAKLARRAASLRKPMRGLETAQSQLEAFDRLPDSMQDSLLATTVRKADLAAGRSRALAAAWAAGEVDTLAALAAESLAETPELVGPLVDARNAAWAQRLDAHLRGRGRIMVAVGAGHLVGPDNLLDRLAARGHIVRRLP